MNKLNSFFERSNLSFALILVFVLGIAFFYTNEVNKKKELQEELYIKHQLDSLNQETSKMIYYYKSLLDQNDTTSIEHKKNSKFIIESIARLGQKKLDLQRNTPDSNLKGDLTEFPFILLVLALLTLTALIADQFVSSFKSNAKNKANVTTGGGSPTDSSDYAVLQWITENEIINSGGTIDLEKATLWKKIYDLSLKLGDQKNDLILSVQDLLATELSQENSEGSQRSDLFNVFEEIQVRLRLECTRLNNQALLNLFIGFFLAFSLLIFNGYVALNTNFGSTGQLKFETFILLYFPKMLAVISILTMFLYFIRLYKTNVIDVKYYQNEITNVEIKLASLRLALLSNNPDVINVLVKDLSNIERNSFLNKDQTSLEIERLKLENEMTKDFLSKTYEFFGGLKEKFRLDNN